MKSTRIVFLFLIMLFLLSSCSIVPSSETKTAAQTDTVTAEVKPLRDPLYRFDSVDLTGYVTGAYLIDETRAVLCAGSVSEEGSETCLLLFDLEEGKFIRKSETLSEGEYVIGVRKNGNIVTSDGVDETIRIYDQTFRCVETMPVPGEEMIYSMKVDREGDFIWWQNLGCINRLDFDGNRSVLLETDGHSNFVAVDLPGGKAVLTSSDSNDETYRAFHLFDISSGKILYSGREEYNSYDLFGDYLIREESVDLFEGDPDNYAWIRVANVYDAKGNTVGRYQIADGYFETESGAPYAVSIDTGCVYSNDPEGERLSEKATLLFTDFVSGKYCRVELEAGVENVTVSHIPGGTQYLVICTSYREGSDDSGFYLIDPARLDWKGRFEPFYSPEPDPQKELSGELASLRESADEIESDYSVRILLGDECLNTACDGSYTIVSTEDPRYSGSVSDQKRELREALDLLRDEISRYPAGFFEKFIHPYGGGGVRFLFVRELENDSFENFGAAAIEYEKGSWYNVAFDIDFISATTVHHELWHAVEDRIRWSNDFAFDWDDWNALNPPGFDYDYDFDNYWKRSDVDKYMLWNEKDVYFARTYSIVTPQEDRATLVEELFDDNYLYRDQHFENSLEMVAAFPHFKAKLDYMADRVREVFGSVYWEQML